MKMQEFEDSHPLGNGKSGSEDGNAGSDGGMRREAVSRLVALGRSLGMHEVCTHQVPLWILSPQY